MPVVLFYCQFSEPLPSTAAEKLKPGFVRRRTPSSKHGRAARALKTAIARVDSNGRVRGESTGRAACRVVAVAGRGLDVSILRKFQWPAAGLSKICGVRDYLSRGGGLDRSISERFGIRYVRTLGSGETGTDSGLEHASAFSNIQLFFLRHPKIS